MTFTSNAETYKGTGAEGARPSQAPNRRLCEDPRAGRAWTARETEIRLVIGCREGGVEE